MSQKERYLAQVAQELRHGVFVSSQEDLELDDFPQELEVIDKLGNTVIMKFTEMEEDVIAHYRSNCLTMAVFRRWEDGEFESYLRYKD